MLLVSSCSKKIEFKLISGSTMGTTYNIKYLPNNSYPSEATLKIEVDKILRDLNQVYSTYIDDSEISLLNQTDSSTWIKIGPTLKQVLKANYEVYKASEGYFDPSVGPLVNLWGFGPVKTTQVPTERDIVKTLELVGFDRFEQKNDFSSFKKPHKQSYLDFSASAKGHAVDTLAMHLDTEGITEYMIEIGGEVRVKGQRKEAWRLAIERPTTGPTRAVQQVILLKNGSMATSGNYRNFFKKGDKKYAHTINPITGQATPHMLLSATVIHQDCLYADSWATAFMSMGEQKALELSNQLEIKAYFIVSNGEELIELSSNTWPFKDNK